jgi:Xaa-Pro aminopeptidase
VQQQAYGSIIASGDRARILHYVNNNEECKDGELILMDFGASYGGYNADLTRTIPVNGKFTRRQKQCTMLAYTYTIMQKYFKTRH